VKEYSPLLSVIPESSPVSKTPFRLASLKMVHPGCTHVARQHGKWGEGDWWLAVAAAAAAREKAGERVRGGGAYVYDRILVGRVVDAVVAVVVPHVPAHGDICQYQR
jgi:hypothetical protein